MFVKNGKLRICCVEKYNVSAEGTSQENLHMLVDYHKL